MDEHINVLLVEDNPGDAQLIRHMLSEARSARFDFTWVDCLSKGLELLASGRFDVILLDLLLPDSQGLDSVAGAYNQVPELPIVVLSGLDAEALAIQAVREGAQDYLLKGQVNSRLLERAIRYAIERKHAEETIKAALREKEILLRELHHRVKNNLQIISSLLYLQSCSLDDETVREMFNESQNRIRSMALIHDKLYQVKDLGKIDLSQYIHELVTELADSYGVKRDEIKLIITVNEILLGVDTAIPCGLIINELVSNSLKHAFPDSNKGEILIDFHRSVHDNTLKLCVCDTGIGFPKDLDFRKAETMGLKLVTTLIKQLKGTIELNRDGGTKFQITFNG